MILITITIAIVISFIVIYFSQHTVNVQYASIESNISKDPQTGNVLLEKNVKNLEDENFQFGDALSLRFSNGFKVENVAYLESDYLNSNNFIMYPNLDNKLVVSQKNDNNFWNTATLNDDDDVEIELQYKNKFNDLVKARNEYVIKNKLNGKQIDNFRAVKGGKLKEDIIFTGPNIFDFNNNINIEVLNKLKENNISTLINVGNKSLDKNTIPNFDLINSEYKNDINVKNYDANKQTINLLKALVKSNKNIYIFSNGNSGFSFFDTIVLMFCGANYKEITANYMDNYRYCYGLTKDTDNDSYFAFKENYLDEFLHKITKTPWENDLIDCDFAYCAEIYIRFCGFQEKDVKEIVNGFDNFLKKDNNVGN